MAEGSYFRVYYEDLMKNHADVWFDMAALFTFNHLLARADKLWPSPAELPRKVSRSGLATCVTSKLIALTGEFFYEVKGLNAMREARQRQTQPARDKLADSKASTEPDTDTVTGPVASHVRARGRSGLVGVESSLSEEEGTLRAQSGELGVLSWMRQQGAQRIVGRVALDLGDLVREEGSERVVRAMADCLASEGKPLDAAQLVYGARNLLRPIPSGRRMSPAENRAAEIEAAKAKLRRGEIDARSA